jgi:RNA polymerase sigma-70 factor (ECF subfamily)
MESSSAQFERLILPHADSAYQLARWLVRNDHDAQDQVQEAYLRAFRAFDRFRGENGRAWFLTIVRNVCFTWLRRNRTADLVEPFDEEVHTTPAFEAVDQIERKADSEVISRALDKIPALFREVIVLRELEGLSYKEIASVADVPIGTIMSRLARARRHLQAEVARQLNESKKT